MKIVPWDNPSHFELWDNTTQQLMTIRNDGGIILYSRGEPYVTIEPDGLIVYGQNYRPDDAGQLFWDAVSMLHPGFRRKAGES